MTMETGSLTEFATELIHSTTMNRFTSLVLAAWCLFGGCFAAGAWAAKPNVIVVMTDDQGYPELSVHGNPVVETPNLDRPLVEGGDQGYGELPIRRASLFISDYHHMAIGEKWPYGFEGLTKTVKPGDTAAVFTVELEKGPMALHTWFQGKGTMLSASYVYVTRK